MVTGTDTTPAGTAPAVGTPGDVGPGVLPGPDTATENCDAMTTRRIRRLSVREYSNVVGDVLGPEFAERVLATLPGEPSLGGFDNQDSALFVSPSFFDRVAALAEDISLAIDVDALAPCASGDMASCLHDFMTSFATRAYGRAPSAEEFERLVNVAELGDDYENSVRLAVEYALQSPHFLYVSELGAPELEAVPGGAISLTPDEIASQLSFMLIGSRPDEELLRAARDTGFAQPDDVRQQVLRLLAEPRSEVELARFVRGWFELAPLSEVPKSEEAYPEFDQNLAAALQQELDAFISAKLADGGQLRGFMTGQSVDVPEALVDIYGDDFVAGVGVNPERRVGLLSLPGFLAYHSSYHHSGPVERGLFVRRQLLCQAVPPPPQAVLDRIAQNPIDYDDETLTTRQKFEVHLDDTSCAACHQLFDPIGFGLEEMDGLGRFRTHEKGLPVDSTGALAGTDVDGPFEGVAELSNKLAGSARFERCAIEHFFRFAQSRASESEDACVLDAWAAALPEQGATIEDLIVAYTDHDIFSRRQDDR